MPFTLLLAASLDDAQFRENWGTGKMLTSSTVALFALGAALFAIGGTWPLLLRGEPVRSSHWPHQTGGGVERLRAASSVVFWLTMTGYLAMAAAGVARGVRPRDLLQAVAAQNASDATGSPLRDYFAPVTGVTTLTQLGIAYIVLGLLVLVQGRDGRTARRILLVLLLALLRTFFLSERLAVLELLIPAVAIIATALVARAPGGVRRVVQAAPFLLVPAVVVAFGVFEYSRSWVFYSQKGSQGFGRFVLDRLAGYYATAYNNGQLNMTATDQGLRVPYQSIEAFWTAPGVAQSGLYERLTGQTEPESYALLLSQYANPEFNSPGGLSVPFVDYGTVGGLVFFLLVGSLLGLAYRTFTDGEPWALLVYPVLVTGLFELPRYLYWGQGRVLPALVALVVVHFWLLRPTAALEPARADLRRSTA